MSLHEDLNRVYGDKFAVFVGESTISHLCLQSLITTLSHTVGRPFPITKQPFATRLVSAKTANNNDPEDIRGTLAFENDEVSLRVKGGIVLEVEIGLIDNPSDPSQSPIFRDVFATVKMLVKDLGFEIEPTRELINCRAMDGQFIPNLQRVSEEEFSEIVTRNGLDPLEVARVEGLISMSAIQSLISLSLSETHSIDLTSLFPGLILSGNLEIDVLGNTQTSDRSNLFLKFVPLFR